jgi:hypothetical protein
MWPLFNLRSGCCPGPGFDAHGPTEPEPSIAETCRSWVDTLQRTNVAESTARIELMALRDSW